MVKTQLAELSINDLIKADWNYKTEGTEEQIEKLITSIKVDKSVGVLAVREISISEDKDGMEVNKFEVIDGNHRLEALIRMNWEKVPCENFGDISKAKAITIARRRNHKWFEDDLLAYATLFKEDVLKEFKIDSYADKRDIGIWIKKNKKEKKIAAIGIRVKKWVAYHGFSINISNDLSLCESIIPCGIKDKEITNFVEMEIKNFNNIEKIIIKKFLKTFP